MGPGGGGTDSHIKGVGDARRKFWIQPLKETNLGMAKAFIVPKRVNKTN